MHRDWARANTDERLIEDEPPISPWSCMREVIDLDATEHLGGEGGGGGGGEGSGMEISEGLGVEGREHYMGGGREEEEGAVGRELLEKKT